MIWLSRISTVPGSCCDVLFVRARILSFSDRIGRSGPIGRSTYKTVQMMRNGAHLSAASNRALMHDPAGRSGRFAGAAAAQRRGWIGWGRKAWNSPGPRSTEVAGQRAARAGHSERVLLATYPHCIPGCDQIASQRIEQAIRLNRCPPLALKDPRGRRDSRQSCVRATTGLNGTQLDP
jgi:hypothetical protein